VYLLSSADSTNEICSELDPLSRISWFCVASVELSHCLPAQRETGILLQKVRIWQISAAILQDPQLRAS
jgi:hypothetical protein